LALASLTPLDAPSGYLQQSQTCRCQRYRKSIGFQTVKNNGHTGTRAHGHTGNLATRPTGCQTRSRNSPLRSLKALPTKAGSVPSPTGYLIVSTTLCHRTADWTMPIPAKRSQQETSQQETSQQNFPTSRPQSRIPSAVSREA